MVNVNLGGLIEITASNARKFGELPSTLAKTNETIIERTAQRLLELNPQNYVDLFKNLPTETQIRTLQNLPPQDGELIYKLLPQTTQRQLYPSLGPEMHRALSYSTTTVSNDIPWGEEAKVDIVKQYLQHRIKTQDDYLNRSAASMRPWAEISPGLSKTNSPDKTIPRSIWNDPGLQLQGKIGLAQLLKEDTIRKNPSFDSLVTARLEQLEKSNPNVTKVDLKAQAERDILEQWEQIETTIQTKAKVPQKRTAEQEAKRYADEHERYINRNDVPKVHQEIDIPKLEDELSLYQRNTNNNAKVNGLSYYERSARIEEIQAILNEHRTTEASKRFGAKPINEKDYQKLYEVSLGQVFGDPT